MSGAYEDEQAVLKAEAQTLRQGIRIAYDLVDFIPLEELTNKETA